jgi:SCY1-like protein 1
LQTKHPRVLTFEWTGETQASGSTVIYLVTEPVQPLAELLAAVALEGEQRLMFLGLGLRQAAQAVSFLNNQCKLIHGNVCLATVLVTPALDWRLAFFDMASEHAHLTTSLLARRVPCAAWAAAGALSIHRRMGQYACGGRNLS